jgi:hypothetical protein
LCKAQYEAIESTLRDLGNGKIMYFLHLFNIALQISGTVDGSRLARDEAYRMALVGALRGDRRARIEGARGTPRVVSAA